jgi:recombination protein RecT
VSICAAVVTSAQLGLEIGILGQAYLVPYFNKKANKMECQFIPGWQGLVDLVQRSGRGSVHTGVIFKDQQYTYRDGATRDLVIHNETALEDADDITHFYAIGWIKGVEHPQIELWPAIKVAKHRDRYNKQGDRHYSFENWEMYGRKVPLLQVIKYMPKSIELSAALELEYAAERGSQNLNVKDAVDGTWTASEQEDQPEIGSGEAQKSAEQKAKTEVTANTGSGAAGPVGEKPKEESGVVEKSKNEDQPAGDPVDVERIKTLLKDATTTDEVMLIMKLAQSVPDAAIRAEISTMSNARVKEIRAAKKTVNEKPKTGSNQFE